jgi:hypothetical protein
LKNIKFHIKIQKKTFDFIDKFLVAPKIGKSVVLFYLFYQVEHNGANKNKNGYHMRRL